MSVLAAVAFTLLAATDPPVEQTKKNIKVLQGLPSSQLIPVMAFISNSLGVTCAHCHEKEWDSDAKPAKTTARKMIAMQRAINESQFGGKLTVTCNTCHRGSIRPEPVPDVAKAGWNKRSDEPSRADTPVCPPRGQAGVPVLHSLVVRGTVERFSGRDAPVSEPFTLTIDDAGGAKYETKLSHPPEAARALGIYLGLPTVAYCETATPFGKLPEAIDYSDVRETAAGKLPFRAQWSRADYRVTYTVEEVTR